MTAPPKGAGTACCPLVRIKVSLQELHFLDDHGKLKNAWRPKPSTKRFKTTYEWRDIGRLYKHPDWLDPAFGQVRNPISYSMVESIVKDDEGKAVQDPIKEAKTPEFMRVRVFLSVDGKSSACPDTCKLVGRYKGKTLFRRTVTLKPSSEYLQEVTMRARRSLARRLSETRLTLSWYIKSKPESQNPNFPSWRRIARTENKRFVIFGPPIVTGTKESGVTHARMDRAVALASSVKINGRQTNDHLEIIKHLFGKFSDYQLASYKTDPKTGNLVIGSANLPEEDVATMNQNPDFVAFLAEIGWSKYRRRKLGTWPMVDPGLMRANFSGECQAIVRMVIGLFHQLGSFPDIRMAYATAHFKPFKQRLVYPGGVPRATGPNSDRRYVLVDSPVQVGKTYIAPPWDPAKKRFLDPPPGYLNANRVGWNNYEAYLEYRVKQGGKDRTYYFGGGLGSEPINRDVLTLQPFRTGGLAEVKGGKYTYRISPTSTQTVGTRLVTGYIPFADKIED